MNDEQRRAFVADMYPGPRWKARVAKMPDSQIYAIYMAKLEYDEKNPKKEDDGQDEIPF